uniref:Uncharacterized protein n=1 Tax=Anguilla anguilla TaxID=7936 RepID=A0A0E9SR95_ANGAN
MTCRKSSCCVIRAVLRVRRSCYTPLISRISTYRSCRTRSLRAERQCLGNVLVSSREGHLSTQTRHPSR